MRIIGQHLATPRYMKFGLDARYWQDRQMRTITKAKVERLLLLRSSNLCNSMQDKANNACYTTKSVPRKFRKPLLPFEIETSAESDILLYACHKKERLFFFISVSGVFLFCVFMNSSELIYRYLGHVKKQKDTENLPWYYWWRKVKFDLPAIRNGTAGLIIIFGFLVLAFALVYPSRMIREITLLKGGEKILLETYRPFGFTKKREIKLKDISAQWGQQEARDHLPLKVKGTRFHFLVDQQGIYFNRRLFDQTVGLHRF